jgi:hypothetical protein
MYNALEADLQWNYAQLDNFPDRSHSRSFSFSFLLFIHWFIHSIIFGFSFSFSFHFFYFTLTLQNDNIFWTNSNLFDRITYGKLALGRLYVEIFSALQPILRRYESGYPFVLYSVFLIFFLSFNNKWFIHWEGFFFSFEVTYYFHFFVFVLFCFVLRDMTLHWCQWLSLWVFLITNGLLMLLCFSSKFMRRQSLVITIFIHSNRSTISREQTTLCSINRLVDWMYQFHFSYICLFLCQFS